MADGEGCTCYAHSASECACDADWTPQIVYDQQVEIARLRKIEAAARNLLAVKGRHHTEQAYKRLDEVLK